MSDGYSAKELDGSRLLRAFIYLAKTIVSRQCFSVRDSTLQILFIYFLVGFAYFEPARTRRYIVFEVCDLGLTSSGITR